jgi:hypothetical protein
VNAGDIVVTEHKQTESWLIYRVLPDGSHVVITNWTSRDAALREACELAQGIKSGCVMTGWRADMLSISAALLIPLIAPELPRLPRARGRARGYQLPTLTQMFPVLRRLSWLC